MLIFPMTEEKTRRDQTYCFTNISEEPLTWELTPFASPYVKDADSTQKLYRVSYDVFKLSPLAGVLQPDETQNVLIEFCPLSKGSYNQAWCIHDVTDRQGSSIRFSIYAKASPSSSSGRSSPQQDIVPQGLTPTNVSKSRTSHSNSKSRDQNTKPFATSRESSPSSHTSATTLNPGVYWSPVPQSDNEIFRNSQKTLSNSSDVRNISGEMNVSQNANGETDTSLASCTASQSSTSCQPNPSGNGNPLRTETGNLKCLQLIHDVIKFPVLHPEESSVRKIYIKNLDDEDTEAVVEYKPKPPFLIKHHSFKVRTNKMVMFPVTFKPRHVAKFLDKVVFRDLRTGNILTATLEAECIQLAS
uniref:Abnormal spindle-like microcephaly-associated protein ASH domain-containing protein n=1 Tax=Arion vulgaris TaxID=1028688 RepID=A0A0B6Z8L5_9EUPU